MSDPTTYDIGFIDPDELIEFTPENERGDVPETSGEPVDSEAQPAAFEVDEEEDFDLDGGEPIHISREVSAALDLDYVERKREDVRGRLALIYMISTFLIFFIGILVAIIDGLNRDVSIIENLKEILPLLSGIFLGSLGFVLGYYFKNKEDN